MMLWLVQATVYCPDLTPAETVQSSVKKKDPRLLTYALPKWLINLEDELNKCISYSTTVSSKMQKKTW